MKNPDGYIILVYNYPEIIVKSKKEAKKIVKQWKKDEGEGVAELFPFFFSDKVEL